ncbi:MAG: dual OB domain-containing protein [Desulfobacteria bacterium]
MEIIITDLTRFSNENIVCIAGINAETNKCIRPLPYLPKKECKGLNILPGAIIQGNFTPKQCIVPHTEDHSYLGKLTFKGPCSPEYFRSILRVTETSSIEEGFSVEFDQGQKHISCDTPPQLSIITLSINSWDLDIVPDSYNPGKIKVIFTDSLRKSYRYISLTDLGFYNYAEKQARDNKIDELNNFIHRQQEVFLRVGLSREYKAPDGRKGFWLQINGIYTFPEYFEDIRCYD